METGRQYVCMAPYPIFPFTITDKTWPTKLRDTHQIGLLHIYNSHLLKLMSPLKQTVQ